MNVRYDIEGQGSGPRKEIWEIPETAFKEAIINALSHRDYYDKGGVIHVEVFDDRVEITNPGGLVSAIPQADFGKRSHSRNPLLFGLLARIHLVEQVGSGINRIKELMKNAELPEPIFQKEGIFTVVLLRNKNTLEKIPDTFSKKSSHRILNMIKNRPEITNSEIALALKLTTRTIERHIFKLKKNGYLKREGSDKTGYWIVFEGIKDL